MYWHFRRWRDDGTVDRVAPLPLTSVEDPRLATHGACAVCGRTTITAPRTRVAAAMVDLNSPTDLGPALALIATDLWTRLSARHRNLGCRVPRGTTYRTRVAGWLCGRCNAARHPDEPWNFTHHRQGARRVPAPPHCRTHRWPHAHHLDVGLGRDRRAR